ncbi:MAG: hypothetical protein KatS3mg093_246 [Candidatus Parcubacteria bacterium]|nr:MAG: hypothetical protein KatS3mg093_246 [Candidatus Parcubacteria bacterium]
MILLLTGALKMFNKFLNLKKKNNGQAALSTIFLIGGIISLIAITLVIIISSYMTSAYSYQNSQRALAVANAGADDALLQLIRNKNFQDVNGYLVYSGNDSATVTVTQNSPSTGQVTILSIANIFSYRKKVRVIVSINDIGEVRVIKREQVE